MKQEKEPHGCDHFHLCHKQNIFELNIYKKMVLGLISNDRLWTHEHGSDPMLSDSMTENVNHHGNLTILTLPMA